MRELALSSGQDTAEISAPTLYRFLKQRGLSERQLLAPTAHKKFETEHSNQIWQSDMLYGPYVQRPGGGKMQALLHAILDDASRLIPHAQFYASQGCESVFPPPSRLLPSAGECPDLDWGPHLRVEL